jgi:hypothetical protein
MCTVTWLRPHRGEYSVFFNRDEQRARAPGHPPREQNRGGVRFLAPVDGEAGGTWLAANEHGLTLGLLNFYEAEHGWRAQHPTSRGLLLLSLIDAPDIGEITRRLQHVSPESYHPFILIAFDPGGLTRAHRWDGRHVNVRDLGEDDMPLTTSSFDTDAVTARRRLMFHRMRETKHGLRDETLQNFHDSRDTHGGAYSVCMTRDDAQTVSFSRVTVTPARVEFFYEPRDGGRPADPSSTAILART